MYNFNKSLGVHQRFAQSEIDKTAPNIVLSSSNDETYSSGWYQIFNFLILTFKNNIQIHTKFIKYEIKIYSGTGSRQMHFIITRSCQNLMIFLCSFNGSKLSMLAHQVGSNEVAMRLNHGVIPLN